MSHNLKTNRWKKNHSTMEKVELEDVQEWITLRRKEAKPGSRSDDDIAF
jgi:hypothetical protein